MKAPSFEGLSLLSALLSGGCSWSRCSSVDLIQLAELGVVHDTDLAVRPLAEPVAVVDRVLGLDDTARQCGHDAGRLTLMAVGRHRRVLEVPVLGLLVHAVRLVELGLARAVGDAAVHVDGVPRTEELLLLAPLGVDDRLDALGDGGEHYCNKSESVETRNPRKVVKYKRVLKGSRKIRPKEEWMKVEVPRIIEPELFYRVQDRLAKNKRARSNNKKHNYLVSGLIDCVCGYARTGDPANGNLYYRCNDRMNHPMGTRVL
jgi:hypothetical protein